MTRGRERFGRPRLKRFARVAAEDAIVVSPDAGVSITLGDPDGQVEALLDLLDGARTLGEIARLLARRWPQLTPHDVRAGIEALDEAGLLEDAAAATSLSARQAERYFSNLAFFGTYATLGRSRFSFQERLREAHVVLLGVGGLGSTLLFNLCGLGVGRVTVLDHDRVEGRNLGRQFLYTEADVGARKVQVALARAAALNSEVELAGVERRITGPGDVAPLLPDATLVLGAVDQPADVRFWINEACAAAGVPFVTGGFQAGRGLYFSFDPGRSGCLACAPREETAPTPPEPVNRGIGPVATLMGSLVALEALRFLTRFAEPVAAGRLWLVDFATGEHAVGFEWSRDPACAVCARSEHSVTAGAV